MALVEVFGINNLFVQIISVDFFFLRHIHNHYKLSTFINKLINIFDSIIILFQYYIYLILD